MSDDLGRSLKQAALYLATVFGWMVFPLIPREKRPLTPHGFKDAVTSVEQIEVWWSEWPDANVGVATGQVSGVVVLDVDPPEGEESLARLLEQHGSLPSTLEAITGRGRQLFFAVPDFPVKNSAGKLGEGLEVRGDGGYVVVPPSVHPNSRTYQWVDPNVAPAVMPQWLQDLLRPPLAPAQVAANAVPWSDADDERVADELAAAVARVRTAPVGTRNDELNRQAFGLFRRVGAGVLDGDAVTHELVEAALEVGLETGEIARTLASAATGALKYPWDGRQRMRTDLGNAERLVDRHGTDLRYCHAWKSWLAWDDTRWARDRTAEVVRRMKDTVRAIYTEVEQQGDEKTRAATTEWWLASEDGRRITEGIKLASSDAAMVVTPDDLDADPWLLNCMNGTVDLRTGELRAHERGDLLTRRSPVAYDPDACSEAWETFLDTATEGDEDMIGFLQRAAGYSLTGATSEEVLFFLYGPGASGKSTFVEALRGALGGGLDGLSTTADFETFLKRQFGGSPRNDLARLDGARAVFSSEVEDGKELAEGVVKALTGGDTVTARFLYREFFEFQPTFKLWLVANHRPAVSADDDAMWRRIRVLPFTHVVAPADRDPKLKAMLKDPERGGPAVLRWAVEGCLAWQRDGLGVPPAVEEATRAYRGDMDQLRGFVGEIVEAAPGHWISSADIRDAYVSWAREMDLDPMSQKRLAERLKEIGGERVRRGGRHGWQGLHMVGDGFGQELAPPS